jgi:predicted TIM-barrel fold metal-dependent hydrolase
MPIHGHFAIALEEHYWDEELSQTFAENVSSTRGGRARSSVLERLFDLGALRIKEMDAAGIDMQILSHGAPSTQRLDAVSAVSMARRVNDRLHGIVRTQPKRFGAFAALPTADPIEAANELERCVVELGFQGAMIHGPSNGVFIDDKRFWPIFERAEALDVPLYLHPADPMKAVVDAYYADYVADFPSILQSGWGFTVETATQAIRLVLSGALDRFPGLKLILGHMGESLPFSLWRISQSMARPRNRPMSVSFRDYFCRHFWITTSGNFSNPALMCSIMEMGVDRVLFAVDYPMVENGPAAAWVPTIPLDHEGVRKIMNGNAQQLLKLDPK